MNGGSETSGARPGGRVLVVDDDRELLETLGELLRDAGYHVATARGRRSGREEAERFRPQAALLDIRLGSDSGIDLLGDLRSAFPELQCIVMTGFSSIDTAMEALHRGAYDYLQKPVERLHLLSVLDRCFEKIGLRARSRDAHMEAERQNERLEALNERLREEAARTASALEDLTRSQERFRLAQRVGRIGTWEVDVGSMRIWASGQAYRLLGLEPRESSVPLDELLDLLRASERVAAMEALQSLITEGGSVDFEYGGMGRMDGEEVWLDIKGEVRRGPDREPAVIVGTIRNITERKRSELALQRLNAELEERVARRTAELEEANRELLAAKEEADQAARQTRHVAEEMGRQLRTPLDNLISSLDKVLTQPLPAAASARVREARTSADVLRQLLARALVNRLPPRG